MSGSGAPRILVVDDDAGIRRLVRTGLELEGFTVIEAATLAQARSVQGEQVDGVVLDRQLPDGDGLEAFDELQERYPGATFVVHSASHVPDGFLAVAKGDVSGLVETFGSPGTVAGPPDVARAAADDIVGDWLELCDWDPELPAGNRPPIAGAVVSAIASALERPQPVGWGLDPALEAVAEAYVLNNDGLDVAVAQLVCLREAYERRVVDHLPGGEQLETARRLTMIVQRLMSVVVRAGVLAMQAEGFTDPLTRLGSSRAYDLDLQRELARAGRHGRPLSVVRLGLDDVDLGHGGEEVIARAAAALLDVPGDEVHAYRLGWSQFALLLPNVVPVDERFVRGPLAAARLGDVRLGIATSPHDELGRLDALAQERMAGSAFRAAVPVREP